jgi:microcystin-dependent protein
MPDNYLGEIKPFAGDFAPAGWAFCNGQLLPIKGNESLYNLFKTQFGGDGDTNFALPNLCSRVAIGQNTASYPLGATGGQEQVTLTVGQLPAHSHPVSASGSAKPNGNGPQNNFWAADQYFAYATAPGETTMNTKSVSATGLGFPHENRVPFIAVSYIIALTGFYPTPA